MATGAQLIERVGHLCIGQAPTTDTRPTIDQAIIWLNEAQRLLARYLHESFIWPLVRDYTPSTGPPATKFILPSSPKVLRIIGVYDNVKQKTLKEITHKERLQILSGEHSYLTTSSFVYTTGNDGTDNVLYYYPESDPAEKTMTYIAVPTDIQNDATEWELPDEFEDIAVDYAVMKYKIFEEEIEAQMAMYKTWMERISFINQSRLVK